MTTDKLFSRRILISAMAGLSALTVSVATIHAEIVVYDKDNWTLSLDGRTSAFYSFETGDAYPHFTAAQIQANGGNPPKYGTPIWSQFVANADQRVDRITACFRDMHLKLLHIIARRHLSVNA